LLGRVFGKVSITASVSHAVVEEGIRLGYADALLVREALTKGHITVARLNPRLAETATRLARRERISFSDSQTLMLARSLGQPLLTDEKILLALGRMFGLEAWNTWTILLEALRMRIIPKAVIHEAIHELGQKRHKVSPKDAKEILDAAKRIVSS